MLQQNIKLCNAKWERQWEWWENNNRSNKQKSNFWHAAHFFLYFFAIVLHDYNMKPPETSWLHVLWRICCTCSCSYIFFHCCSFSPWWQLALVIFSLVQLNSKYIQNYSKYIQNYFVWNILLKSLRLKLSISLAFLILSGSPFHSFGPRK